MDEYTENARGNRSLSLSMVLGRKGFGCPLICLLLSTWAGILHLWIDRSRVFPCILDPPLFARSFIWSIFFHHHHQHPSSPPHFVNNLISWWLCPHLKSRPTMYTNLAMSTTGGQTVSSFLKKPYFFLSTCYSENPNLKNYTQNACYCHRLVRGLPGLSVLQKPRYAPAELSKGFLKGTTVIRDR